MATKTRSRDKTELFIVSDNITKEKAYFGHKDASLRRIAQGVYIERDANFREVFQTYGIRLVRRFFPLAALTHATAWYKCPMDDRVFVGGDYPYKKVLVEDGYEGRIVQSMVFPDFTNPLLYKEVKITDPLGSFKMWCATPELVLLHQMDATKVNVEKRLPDEVVQTVWLELKKRYGGRGHAFDVIEKVGDAAGKTREADRFLKSHYRDEPQPK